MGCDIDYYLDHDLINLNAQEFLEEFKKRVAPLKVFVHRDYWGDYGEDEPDQNNDYWEIICSGEYEKDYPDICLLKYEKGKNCGWEIGLDPKAISIYFFDGHGFLRRYERWRQFELYYLQNRDPVIEKYINETIAELEKQILPIFHCTKLIAIGDQGIYPEYFQGNFYEGKSIDELVQQNKKIDINDDSLDSYVYIEIYKHGEDKRWGEEPEHYYELPVWMHEFK